MNLEKRHKYGDNCMKKIVVIGANSYIARNLVFYIKNNYNDYEMNLYDIMPDSLDGNSNYKMINVLDKESISKIDMNCDVIFMFVGKTGTINGFDNYETYININEVALLNLLNEYRVQNSKAKIIFPSTRLVYKGKKGKIKECDLKEFKTVYAINKYACEKYLEQYSNIYGVQYCIFRICVPYGTLIKDAQSYGTAEFMLTNAKKGEDISLYGDGSVRRTITYIGDLCRILIEGAVSDKCINDVYNIGGEDYSLKDMAEPIAKKYGVSITYKEWPEISRKIESGDTVFNDEKLKHIIKVKYEMKFKNWCENS